MGPRTLLQGIVFIFVGGAVERTGSVFLKCFTSLDLSTKFNSSLLLHRWCCPVGYLKPRPAVSTRGGFIDDIEARKPVKSVSEPLRVHFKALCRKQFKAEVQRCHLST